MCPCRPPRTWLGTSTASESSLPSFFLPKHHHFHKLLMKSKQLQAGVHWGEKENQTEPNKLRAGCPAMLLACPPKAGSAYGLSSFPSRVPGSGTITLFKMGLAVWGTGAWSGAGKAGTAGISAPKGLTSEFSFNLPSPRRAAAGS